jgi:aminocarboxymuconate-semialdehyde decarboxylase
MHSRRSFLGAVCGATAGLMLSKPVFGQGRREVIIDGYRVKVVDFHNHAFIEAVEDVVRGTPLERNIGGPALLTPDRVGVLDEWGIDTAVLSANQYWWYAADRRLAERIIRVQDEGLAEFCAMFPGRFVALSSVALQHPDLAADQLEYAVNELGFKGASVGGHVSGDVPAATNFDPFWERCVELGVPVFIHPNGSSNLVQQGWMGVPGDLGNTIGNPLETTYFLTRLIFDGTFDRFPDLRIVGAHGAGYLPSYFGRTDVACRLNLSGLSGGATDCQNELPPREYLRRNILADTMVFSDEGLRHLVAEMGVENVVYGTDIPFGWPDTMDLVLNASFLTNEQKRMVLGGNMINLLNLDRDV